MFSQRDLPRLIWTHTILIMSVGLIALYSASYNNVRVAQDVFYDQLFCAGLGLLIMFMLERGDYRKFYDLAYPLYAMSIVLLIMVLFMGRSALGATRWFSLGPFSFQPSELSKLMVILFLGRYFADRRVRLSTDLQSTLGALWSGLFWPLVLVMISFLLIFKQPDLGTAILVFSIFLVMLYESGLALKWYLALVSVIVAFIPFGWHLLKQYQKNRLTVFLNPNHDPTGAGYTIIQSKIAIGSGQLWGKGWLSGTQNQLNFLPERHTDFIFSVIGEEWGLLGGLFLLYCYLVIIFAGFKIITHNKDRFGQLVALGIVSIISIQVVINMGMVMGLLPVVGITLPFISYGRTSFLVFAIMIGFLLNLNRKRAIF